MAQMTEKERKRWFEKVAEEKRQDAIAETLEDDLPRKHVKQRSLDEVLLLEGLPMNTGCFWNRYEPPEEDECFNELLIEATTDKFVEFNV